MTPGRCSRGVRAATFAAVCVLLAAIGHVLMSEQDLPAPALCLALAGTLAVAWVLARRERGLFVVTAATVAVQSALHTVFSWWQRGDAPTAPRMPVDHFQMGHAAMGHMPTGPGTMGHAAMDHAAMGHETVVHDAVAHDMTDMSSSFGMLSAHLLAALLSGLWMAYGERAVFRLVRALPLGLFRPLRLLIAAVVPAAPGRPRIRRSRAGDERAPRPLVLAHSVISRGPPQALAVS